MPIQREFDVVVFGATSVTGREVCAYLERRAGELGVQWAPAGRSEGRVREALGPVGVDPVTVVVADADEPESLAAMAGRARVVLNLVGPYARQAAPVIDACISAGAHYVDLTGETPFVRRVQDRFDGPAREAGVKVVQTCGFEALPPDLAILLAAEAAAERYGEALAAVDIELSTPRTPLPPRLSDIMSGGTLQSLVDVIADPDAASVADPALLIGDPGRAAQVRSLSPFAYWPRRAVGGGALAAMIPVGTINPPVVHRSAELDDRPPFRYREGFAVPGGRLGLVPGTVVGAALGGINAALFRLVRASPERRSRVAGRLRRTLPGSGYGPAADRLDAWRWHLAVRAETSGGETVSVEVSGDGHPGYRTTATMLGEAGLALAAPGATPDRAGCLTPAVALGTASVDRLAHAGLHIRLESEQAVRLPVP